MNLYPVRTVRPERERADHQILAQACNKGATQNTRVTFNISKNRHLMYFSRKISKIQPSFRQPALTERKFLGEEMEDGFPGNTPKSHSVI